jgi:hypothetical protein
VAADEAVLNIAHKKKKSKKIPPLKNLSSFKEKKQKT